MKYVYNKGNNKIFSIIIITIFYFLILSIFISPRYRIGNLANGKSVDIRLEDILIFLIVLLYLISLFNGKKFCYPYIFDILIIAYIFIIILSSFLSLLYTPINIGRFLYLLKDLEFFILYLIIVQYYKYINIEVCNFIFLLGIIINLLFSCYQILIHRYLGFENGYYGIAAVNEYSTLSSVVIYGFATLYFLNRNGKINFFLAVISFISSVFTFSRIGVISLILSYILFILFMKKRNFIFIIIFAMIGYLLFYYSSSLLSARNIYFSRFINKDYYLYSILERINYDYIPIIKKTYEINPILGIGKGLLGEIGLPIETHNYYIRVFMETGIIGLFIFISIFISIFIFLKDSIKYSNIGKVFLNFTLFLLIISFFQDAFANQKSLSLFSILFSIVSINEKRKLDNNSCYFIYKL